jgi:hypothetical protein
MWAARAWRGLSSEQKTEDEQKRRDETARFTWFFRHSFFLSLMLLFALALTMHVVMGTSAYNQERTLAHQPPISVAAFLLSATFWSSTLDT